MDKFRLDVPGQDRYSGEQGLIQIERFIDSRPLNKIYLKRWPGEGIIRGA